MAEYFVDADMDENEAFSQENPNHPKPGHHHFTVEDAKEKPDGLVVLKCVVLAGESKDKYCYKTIFPPSSTKANGEPLTDDQIKAQKRRVFCDAHTLGVLTKEQYVENKRLGKPCSINFVNCVGAQFVGNVTTQKDKPGNLHIYMTSLDDPIQPKNVVYDEAMRQCWFEDRKLVYPGAGKAYVADPRSSARKAQPETTPSGAEASVF